VAWRDDGGGRAATVLALREAVEVPATAAVSLPPVAPSSSSSSSSFSWFPPGFPSSGNRSNSSGSSRGGSSRGSSSAESNTTLDKEKKKKKSRDTKKKLREEKKTARKEAADSPTLFAVVDELSLPSVAGEFPRLLRSCPVDFPLTHENKGLEDLYYLSRGRALALCEGNRCAGGAEGRERGHGRILVLRLEEGEGGGGTGAVLVGGERAAAAAAAARARTAGGGSGGPRPVAAAAARTSSSSAPSRPPSPSPPLFAAPCAWRVEAVLDLPGDALFEDYSGLAVRGGLAAVLSQRDEAAFVAGFDAERLEFAPVPEDKRYRRRTFSLPRSSSCERAFCTAEGIDLVDDPLVRGVVRVVVATDKASAGSPWGCVGTAEAVHVMSLPKHALPQAPDGTEREEKKEEEEREGEEEEEEREGEEEGEEESEGEDEER
jgi:hypothetical protein